jgi:hypothetical protein
MYICRFQNQVTKDKTKTENSVNFKILALEDQQNRVDFEGRNHRILDLFLKTCNFLASYANTLFK